MSNRFLATFSVATTLSFVFSLLSGADAFGSLVPQLPLLAQQQRQQRSPAPPANNKSITTQLCLAAVDDDTNDNKSSTKNEVDDKAKNDALLAAIESMYGDQPVKEDQGVTQGRIRKLIQDNKVVLFMKGTKFFPQCGFSDTATKILEALDVEYEAVDVLSDDAIRQGIKDFSQWPTIPQLYIKEEFIGGSDIMINMFESGELKKELEK